MQVPDQAFPAPGSIAAILPAAGSGQRFGAASNKLFAELAGKPLWFHAASRLANSEAVGRVVLVVSQVDQDVFRSSYAAMVEQLGVELVLGGSERTDSVRAGLEHLAGDATVRWVAIHDAARPLIRASDMTAVFSAVQRTGAAILATPVPGTVKRGKLDRS